MEVEPTISAKGKMSLAILDDDIVEDKYKIQHILPIVLEGDAKVVHVNIWRIYRERISQL